MAPATSPTPVNLEASSSAITLQPTTTSVAIPINHDHHHQPDSIKYPPKSKLVAFLLSFFLGEWGADWFYLSAGSSDYICLGVLKLFTCGGCGIWWLIDWIRVLADIFPDGQGRTLDNNNF